MPLLPPIITSPAAGATVTQPFALTWTPACDIAVTAPADGVSVVSGTSVSFAATASDATGVTWAWSSSRDGALSTAASFSRTNLSVGAHTITLVATRAGQSVTVTRTVTVTAAANAAPVVTITGGPASGATITAGAAGNSYTATATDAESGTLTGSIVWRANGTQVATGASYNPAALGAGSYLIEASATDGGGLTTIASRNLTVAAAGGNTAPTAAITTDYNALVIQTGATYSLAGTGTDTQDGALTGTKLAWTRITSGARTALGTGSPLTGLAAPAVGSHTVELVAGPDAGGLSSAPVTRPLRVVTLLEDFAAATVGALPAGCSLAWDSTSGNFVAATVAAGPAGSISGKTLRCVLATAPLRRALRWDSAGTVTDGRFVVRARTTHTTAAEQAIAVMTRCSGDGTAEFGYALVLFRDAGGVRVVQLRRYNGTSALVTIQETTAGVNWWEPDTTYLMEISAQGTTITGRMYAESDTALATPLVSLSGTDATYASGWPGVLCFGDGTHDFSRFTFATA